MSSWATRIPVWPDSPPRVIAANSAHACSSGSPTAACRSWPSRPRKVARRVRLLPRHRPGRHRPAIRPGCGTGPGLPGIRRPPAPSEVPRRLNQLLIPAPETAALKRLVRATVQLVRKPPPDQRQRPPSLSVYRRLRPLVTCPRSARRPGPDTRPARQSAPPRNCLPRCMPPPR